MYNSNLVLNPMMAGVFRCKDCHMNFQGQHLLTKHKLKFCVGSTSDPDDLQLRRGFRSTSPRVILSPDDRDEYKKYTNQDQQLRNLAENHGRQMEYLNLRNRDLEKQREDIRRQLENLGRKTVVPPQDNTADLLRELREQEIRNQRALDELKRQLHDLQGNQKVNVIEVERPVYPQQPPPPPPEPPKRSLVFPVYYGKSLVAEIVAIRQAYLQNGGNDPDTLAQMSQMQAEAQAIEDQMNQKPENKSPREKPKDNDAAVRLLEMENDRLNQEFRLLQEQNLRAQNWKKSDKEGKDVHVHINVPKSLFVGKSHKKHKIVRKNTLPPPPVTSDQHLVGVMPAAQPVQSFNYVPQQPYLTVYNLPQEQPSVPMYNMPQQQQVQTVDPNMYPQQFGMVTTLNVPKQDFDARSYYSEPNKRSNEKVVKYTANHGVDGSVRILRSNSFGHIDHRPRPYIPPLDLRGIVTPTGNRRDKENKGKKDAGKQLNKDKPGNYKPQPFNSKLSHVSEGPEQENLSPTDDALETHLLHPPEGVAVETHPFAAGAYQKLPGIPVDQGSRPEGKPMSRSGEGEPAVFYDYESGHQIHSPERPASNQTLMSQGSEKANDQRESPTEDEIPDFAWQVTRSSPPLQNLSYDYQY